MRTMIVDDELPALNMLKSYVTTHGELTLVHATTEGANVLADITTYKPTLLFLDINIGHISGVELAEEINKDFPEINIIFVTAYSEYAVKAFELNAIDYLLKPVTKKRFAHAVSRLDIPSDNQDEPDKQIKMTLFKEGRIQTSNGEDIALRTRKAYELLFLLRHYSTEGILKDKILELLWPNLTQESSSMMLHTTIYQIRQTFKKSQYINPIHYKKGRYFLNIEVQHDLDEVCELLASPAKKGNLNRLLELYQGPYLESDHFEWCETTKNKIQHQFIQYILLCLEENIMELADWNRLMLLYKEDFWVELNHISTIKEYYVRNHRYAEEIQLLRDVERFWKQEFGVSLPRAIH